MTLARALDARTPQTMFAIDCSGAGPVTLGPTAAVLVRPGEQIAGFAAGVRRVRFDRAVLVDGSVAGRVRGVLATRVPSIRDIEQRIDGEALDGWATVAMRGELVVRHRIETRLGRSIELRITSESINPFAGLVRRQVTSLDAERFSVRTRQEFG